MSLTFDRITLNTSQLDKMLSFYSILGANFEKSNVLKGGSCYKSQIASLQFNLYEIKTIKPQHQASIMISLNVNKLDILVEKLKNIEGVHVIMDVFDFPDGKRAIIMDPDGHSVELNEVVL